MADADILARHQALTTKVRQRQNELSEAQTRLKVAQEAIVALEQEVAKFGLKLEDLPAKIQELETDIKTKQDVLEQQLKQGPSPVTVPANVTNPISMDDLLRAGMLDRRVQ